MVSRSQLLIGLPDTCSVMPKLEGYKSWEASCTDLHLTLNVGEGHTIQFDIGSNFEGRSVVTELERVAQRKAFGGKMN